MLPEYVDRYLTVLGQALACLDRQAILAVVDELIRAWRQRRQIILFGNGGSAALASHMANDLNKLTIVPGQPRLRAISLTDNVPLITAWANDTEYVNVFAEPLRNLCQPGDLVIAVSCSGNSPNVLEALKTARELGARTVGFTGADGGQLKDLVDLCILAPVGAIWQQEDVHMVLNHLLSTTFKTWLSAVTERIAHPPKALVLAAGEGKRLRPLTQNLAKPMVPLNGKPLLEYTIGWLRQHGIGEIAVNLHHCPESIVDHFGDGSSLDTHIIYSYENPILGTAGALGKLNGFLEDGPLVVVYGDVLTDMDLGALLAFHHENVVRDPATCVTMSLYRVPNPTEVGLVALDGGGQITRFVEKPKPNEVFTDLASAGVMVVEPSIVKHIPANTFCDFGTHLFPGLLADGHSLYGWVIPDETYLLDIGTPEKYAQAQREWGRRHEEV